MTTDNILDLDNLNLVVGKAPYSRHEGVIKTLTWMSNENKNISN